MKNAKTFIVSLFVLTVFFFLFRSAQASPSAVPAWQMPASGSGKVIEDALELQTDANDPLPAAPFQLGKGVENASEPSQPRPAGREAPDVTADLSVTVSDSPDPVLLNQSLTYTVIVTNNTPGVTVANAVLTDTLPASVNYVSATPAQGSCANTSPGVVCDLGSMTGVNSVQVVIVVTPTAVGPLSNSVEVGFTDPDLDPDIDLKSG